TPNLDAMAKAGATFTHCYSQPLCTPSRVKLMTGLSNIRNYTSFGILPRGETTFAHILQRAGYRTCVVGKWQLFGSRQERLPAGSGTLPADAGFDEHLLWQVDRIGSRYADPLLVENGRYLETTQGRYGPDVFADHAVDFIRRQRALDQRYLLYYPMALVHDPFDAPPGTDPGPEGKAGVQHRFAAMMHYMDAVVGRILAAIDDNGGRERTLVLFVGDNGTGRAITSRCRGQDVQGGKGLPNDRGTHVPLFARWPGTVPANHRSDALVDFSDFLPTLCAAAAEPLPADLHPDGFSFLPQLRGEPGPTRDSIFVYYNPRPERPQFPRGRFARDRRFKLYGDGRLYDLTADPEEERPLAGEAGDGEIAAARAKLAAAIARMPEHPLALPAEHR
ncbi:MAG: sulfatase-like hydrolase/transferase, partial [Planctomycetes bacterium]|nr:sulfatase-like hydrolase/transferase [Planctomycetota bacterium]